MKSIHIGTTMSVLYEMPSAFREALSKPYIYLQQGTQLIVGSREAVASVLRSQYYLDLYDVVAVGDYVCGTLVKYVGVPRICIVDGKTLRCRDVDFSEMEKIFIRVERCRNPPGHISRTCLDTIQKCFREGVKCLIVVDGEEDLLALASLITIPRGYVIYGIPSLGVAVSDAHSLKIYTTNIFSHFKSTQIQ